MRARIPGWAAGLGADLWIPSPERAFTLIALIAGLTFGLAVVSGAAPPQGSEPWVTRPEPVKAPAAAPTAAATASAGEGFSLPFGLFRPAPTGPTILERGPSEGVLLLDEVLPLSRNFEPLTAATGKLTPELAADTWSDPVDLLRRFQEWGFISGATTAYWRPQLNADSAAPVAIRSSVAMFRDVNSADVALRYRRERLTVLKAVPLAVGSPSDGITAFKTSSGPFSHYLVEFRRANALATLWVAGYAARNDIDLVRGLALIMLDRVR
ncbi:MAG: hypothetical protein EXR51_09515 [Dehalococcoidia bacterium]|nr:hypothetical protein [Dehalococcoidia bacterium]